MKNAIVLFVLIISTAFASCSKKEHIGISQNTTVQDEVPQFQLKSETYCDEGENEDPQPLLSGNVNDSLGNAIYHACVEIRTTGGLLVAVIGTNINGHYFFNSVSSGGYVLVVSASGYTTKSTPFSISGSPITLNVVL